MCPSVADIASNIWCLLFRHSKHWGKWNVQDNVIHSDIKNERQNFVRNLMNISHFREGRALQIERRPRALYSLTGASLSLSLVVDISVGPVFIRISTFMKSQLLSLLNIEEAANNVLMCTLVPSPRMPSPGEKKNT